MESWGEFSCPLCPGDHGDPAGIPTQAAAGSFWHCGVGLGRAVTLPGVSPDRPWLSSPFQSFPREAPHHCREGRPGALAPAQVPGPV